MSLTPVSTYFSNSQNVAAPRSVEKMIEITEETFKQAEEAFGKKDYQQAIVLYSQVQSLLDEAKHKPPCGIYLLPESVKKRLEELEYKVIYKLKLAYKRTHATNICICPDTEHVSENGSSQSPFKTERTTTMMNDKGQLVRVMEGSTPSRLTNVGKDVAAFATKRILLPIPLNREELERRRIKLIQRANCEDDKIIVDKATKGILHITFPMLLTQLRNCIRKFNSIIGAKNYEGISATYKSNEWVWQLALKNGINPPIKIHSTSNCQLSERIASENIVIVDESAYTGGQIRGMLNFLADWGIISEESDFSRKHFRRSESVRNIFVIVPFISSIAKQKFETIAMFAKILRHVNITIITSQISIPIIMDVLNEEEMNKFCEIFDADTYSLSGCCLAITDWRIPDYESSPSSLFEGKIYKLPVETEEKYLVDLIKFSPYKYSGKLFPIASLADSRTATMHHALEDHLLLGTALSRSLASIRTFHPVLQKAIYLPTD